MSCRSDTANVACAERRMAVLKGRFHWRSGHGWVWKDATHPDQTWERCPWCDNRLPDLDDFAIARAKRYPQWGEGEE